MTTFTFYILSTFLLIKLTYIDLGNILNAFNCLRVFQAMVINFQLGIRSDQFFEHCEIVSGRDTEGEAVRMSRLFNNENALIKAIKKNRIRQIKKLDGCILALPSAQYETQQQRCDNYFLLSHCLGISVIILRLFVIVSGLLMSSMILPQEMFRTPCLQSPFQVHQQLLLCDVTLQQ